MPDQVETIFLDAGGVLIYPNWDRVSAVLARHGVAVSGDVLRRGEPAAKFSIDRSAVIGSSDDAQRGWVYLHRVLENAGIARSAAVDAALDELGTYHMTHNLWEHVPADVRPALERLAATGRQLVVVSNANGLIERLFARLDLARFFTVICDSCVEGVEKPDPRFFRIALDRAGARPETTVHVGDLYHVDVLGARAAGLDAILFDPHDLYGDFDARRIRSLEQLLHLVGRGLSASPGRP
jgi:putative hydrolase of the HAD superfamily